MGVVGLLSLGSLIAASLGWYRLFSYLAAGVILSVFASATVEQNDHDLDVAPYRSLIGVLAVCFVVGLTGIWLTWTPGTESYTYLLGVPEATFIYYLFIWVLPLGVAIYYAFLFDRIAGEEIVESIISDAEECQRDEQFPLAPEEVRHPLEEPAVEPEGADD